jgi:adenylate cyclase
MDVRTPGVTVHAAVASGILSGHWKVPAPMWADGLAILALGLGATIIAIRLPVGTGAIAVAVLALAYSAVNAFVVFDRGNIALHAAGPLVALTTAWAACTAMRAIQEAREKGAIRRQFRSRVSSQLVDYLAENPDLMNMEGEEREVTTMFTDFVGFTSISESLEGKATVKLLNVYLGEIAEALMQEGAYVNKFLGDGIMAFWGAPVDQPDHAARACRAAIAAVATLERVNNLPEYKDLPKLGMRLGISTGKAIVGDCGAPPKLNDYTVIGDPINLAARLESANKLVGTRILVTARTRELIPPDERNALAWRPMGLLRVVGQQKPQEIWELLGPRSWVDEDPELREWIDKTTKAVELFRAGDYAGALPLWQDLVLFERGQAGALLYVERCAELIDSGEVNPALPLRSK